MVPPRLDNRPVSDKLLHDLVKEPRTSRKMRGRRLRLSEGALRNIDEDNRGTVEKDMAAFCARKQQSISGVIGKGFSGYPAGIIGRDLSENVSGMFNFLSFIFTSYTDNSLLASTCKRPPPVSDHFVNNHFVSHDQSNTVSKTLFKRPLLKFLKRPRLTF